MGKGYPTIDSFMSKEYPVELQDKLSAGDTHDLAFLLAHWSRLTSTQQGIIRSLMHTWIPE